MMSSSDPNRLSIRIEISAPVGGGVSVVDLNNPPQPVRGSRFFPPLFDPVSPSVLGCQPVTVESGTSLGSISAQVAYATSPPDEVKAIVFPVLLWHDHDQPPLNAVAGVPNSDKSIWSWGPETGNRLRGVDHTSMDSGAFNALSVWRKKGADWAPDGTVLFYGKTGACGSGSGSGSFVGTVATVSELADTPQLRVVIPDGPNAGQYPLTPAGPRAWRLVTRSGAYEISTSDGIVFTLRGSCGAAVSTRATYHPFSAMFPGALVGASLGVMVTRV